MLTRNVTYIWTLPNVKSPSIIFHLFPGIHSWIVVHLIGHSFAFLWSSYSLLILLRVFIPISEKSFHANPEAIISLLCGLIPIFTMSYFVSFTTKIMMIFEM